MPGDDYVPLIHGQLTELKKLCGNLFHKQIRDSIIETEQYFKEIHDKNETINLSTALKPFFLAMADEKKVFQSNVLDCFYKVFHQANEDLYPDEQLTIEIIKILVKTDFILNDELNLKCCNMCISCLKSPCGIRFAHGKLLRKMFKLLFKIYNHTNDKNTLSTIETSINQTVKALFHAYKEPLEIPSAGTPEELAKSVVHTIVENATTIIYYIEPVLKDGYNISVRDIDVFVVLSLLSEIIEEKVMRTSTIKLAAQMIVYSLKQNCDFYQSPIFKYLLSTKLHVAFLSLTLDSHKQLVSETSELLLILWSKFAPMYTEGLNEILVKGLLTTLISPEFQVLSRSLAVYEQIAKQPQLFVDCFINFDCDQSGYFQNVFENTVSQISKLAYPDTMYTRTQGEALRALVAILKSMWKYFDTFEISESAASSQEPESPQNFLEAKKAKDVFNTGLDVFKRSYKKGLAFFAQHNIIEDDPVSIAKFFFTTPALDPASVGEALGSSGEKSANILKEFTNLFDFKGMTFEQAFRAFLCKFQIPGEAQMIDRVMERFGTKFYEDNPTLFSCADTVYVLSFSTLMLHTDAWHPHVKSRMTLDEFVANNKGIDGGRDLPFALLEDLYKGITSQRIFLPGTAMPNSALLTRAQRADLYKSQAAATLETARQRRDQIGSERSWHRSESPLYIEPMFQVVWRGALAVLTMTFEMTQDPEIYKVCLEGLETSIHIASHCYIEVALDTLVDSFAKFTNLRKSRELVKKNVECTNALIRIAMDDRHFLRGAWDIVMGEVSALDLLKDQQQFNTDLVSELFTTSEALDRESLVDFVRAICTVSRMELGERSPRIYSLQKLMDVAYSNISKPWFIWKNVWDVIARHLVYVGCMQNVSIAEVAIDLVKQLAAKFMVQEEMAQFHFQQTILLPFEQIFEAQQNHEVRELILTYCAALVSEMSGKLQSGWSVIFRVLILAALDDRVARTGIEFTKDLVNKHLDEIAPNAVHVVTILNAFAKNPPVDIRIEAVQLYGTLATCIEGDNLDVWSSLFQAVSESAMIDNKGVIEESHAAFVKACEAAKEKEVLPAVWTDALTAAAPDFFVEQHVDGFFELAVVLLMKLVTMYIQDSAFNGVNPAVMKFLFRILQSSNDYLISATLDATCEVIDAKGIDDESIKFVVDGLHLLGPKVPESSLENEHHFINLVLKLTDDKRLAPDCLDVLSNLASVAASPDRRGIVRFPLLKATEAVNPDQSVSCLSETLKAYSSPDGDCETPEWDAGVAESANFVVGLDDDGFMKFYQPLRLLFVDCITTTSRDVRTALAKLFKRGTSK